mmetsp:Transcript_59250/g.136766  ORF Transcript_59250/g.136766 Transcript_59250/m.136766 type:complete len:260 (-) Transcript_59250:65-844(-)
MRSGHVAPELVGGQSLDESPRKRTLDRTLNRHLRAILKQLASRQRIDPASGGISYQRLRGVPHGQRRQIQEPGPCNVVPQLAVVDPPPLDGAVHRRGHMLRVHVGHHTVASVQQQGNLDCWREPLQPIQNLQEGDQPVLPTLCPRRAHRLPVQPGLLRCIPAEGGISVAVHDQVVVEKTRRQVVTIVAGDQIGLALVSMLASGVLRSVPSESKQQAVPRLRPGYQPVERVQNGIPCGHLPRFGILIHQYAHLVSWYCRV